MESAIHEFWPGGPRFFAGRGFAIGTDAVLLAHFSHRIRADRVCDFGCGSGIIGILLALAQPSMNVTGVDILSSAVRAAADNAELNGLGRRYRATQGDLREYRCFLPAGGYDLVVMNPPYYPAGSGKLPKDAEAAAARSEESCSLLEACQAASWAVRWGGRFCLIHKPERTAELCYTLHENGLEPKRLRFVLPRAGKAPNLVLLEAIRGASPGLVISPSLLLADDTGGETAEIKSIYHR